MNKTKHITQEGWQPIETAPKDGTTIIAYRPTTPPHVEGMHYTDGSWYWSYDGDGPDAWSVQPTLWMPLPPPPTQEGGGMNENGTGVPACHFPHCGCMQQGGPGACATKRVTDHMNSCPAPDWLTLAKQCGGITYTNRHMPGEPAVAFGNESWARFTEALSKLAPGVKAGGVTIHLTRDPATGEVLACDPPGVMAVDPLQDTGPLGYAARLADGLWRKHYQQDAPNWQLCPDLLGILTQIDNMTTGLTKKPTAGVMAAETQQEKKHG